MTVRKRKWTVIVGVIVLLVILDGLKSYAVGRARVTRIEGARNIRLSSMIFVGLWRVAFRIDAWHKDAMVIYTVPPLLPTVIGEIQCD